jgi:glycosyltransferase involved in cell wall biosynthesis
MNYAPNEVGALWFARDVWPLVRRAHPSAVFRIVGASPTRAIRGLASGAGRIEVIGAVPKVQPYLWDAAVSVAPIHLAQGLQNKVLEALAAGLPVVTTATVGAGLPVEARGACLVADSARSFADAVLQTLRLPPRDRRRRASAARLDELSWDVQLAPVEHFISSVSRSVA